MQYLLSEEEFNKLQEEATKGRRTFTEKQLQEFCTMVADNLPIETYWTKSTGEKAPWGCIRSKEYEDDWYCDECPSKKICPYPHKNWSQ